MSATASLAALFPVEIGRRIELESSGWTQMVTACEWEGAPFRITTNVRAEGPWLPTKSGYVELACRIEVTGRTVQFHRGARVVRVRVTYVNEENAPETHVGGWMFV